MAHLRQFLQLGGALSLPEALPFLRVSFSFLRSLFFLLHNFQNPSPFLALPANSVCLCLSSVTRQNSFPTHLHSLWYPSSTNFSYPIRPLNPLIHPNWLPFHTRAELSSRKLCFRPLLFFVLQLWLLGFFFLLCSSQESIATTAVLDFLLVIPWWVEDSWFDPPWIQMFQIWVLMVIGFSCTANCAFPCLIYVLPNGELQYLCFGIWKFCEVGIRVVYVIKSWWLILNLQLPKGCFPLNLNVIEDPNWKLLLLELGLQGCRRLLSFWIKAMRFSLSSTPSLSASTPCINNSSYCFIARVSLGWFLAKKNALK